MHDAARYIMEQLEADMFAGPRPMRNLTRFLTKLGIKSAAHAVWGQSLKMESLEATLKSVSFDEKKVKLWKSL